MWVLGWALVWVTAGEPASELLTILRSGAPEKGRHPDPSMKSSLEAGTTAPTVLFGQRYKGRTDPGMSKMLAMDKGEDI